MSSKPTSIDYVATYFPVKTLTRIHSEPDYQSLKRLKDELQKNAASVETNLGGGRLGHLGLVIAPAEYTLVSATPYNRPAHPGAFVSPYKSG